MTEDIAPAMVEVMRTVSEGAVPTTVATVEPTARLIWSAHCCAVRFVAEPVKLTVTSCEVSALTGLLMDGLESYRQRARPVAPLKTVVVMEALEETWLATRNDSPGAINSSESFPPDSINGRMVAS